MRRYWWNELGRLLYALAAGRPMHVSIDDYQRFDSRDYFP